MIIFWACAGTAAYVLIGVRVAAVARRASQKSEADFKPLDSALIGAMWPVMMLIVGIGVCLSGHPGIYGTYDKIVGR
jgi:hypothetical protein